MGRPRKPARAVFWHGAWHFFHYDETGHQKRIKCEAVGCFNDEQRNARVKLLREKERHDDARLLRLGYQTDYDHKLVGAVKMFLAHSDARREITDSTKREVHKALDPFVKWLDPHRTTGGLDGPLLSSYLNALQQSAATVNKVKRNIKAMLRWLMTVRPPMLPGLDHLMPALKQTPIEPDDALAFTPAELRAMCKRLDEDQRRLFLFLCVTGCRIEEAEALTWDDVDLARGRIHFRSAVTKTHRQRILPLINAPEGDVGPGLLKAMKDWDRPCGARHRREHWRPRAAAPHTLRANWVSYAASFGIPAPVAAIWAGHSAAVAERHYRMQVLERIDADSLQGAMGL